MGKVKGLLSDQYWEGWEAFEQGVALRDNPYIVDPESMKTVLASQPQKDWSWGWRSALAASQDLV